jgi:hypothetical protein
VREFQDARAVVEAIRANSPVNGVYLAPQGVFAAVSLEPDLADKSQDLTPQLLTEWASASLAALFLSAALLTARSATVAGGARLLAVTALAAVANGDLAYWNWYGFSTWFTLQELVDLVGGWLLAGSVLGALMKRMVPREQNL